VPLYEYECVKCGRHTERIEKVSGPHLKSCPHCGGKVERVQAAPAIQFKGSGWYVTDYAQKPSGAAAPESAKDASRQPQAATRKRKSLRQKRNKSREGNDARSTAVLTHLAFRL